MNESQWWQHKYNRLVAECFEPVPFDPAEHEDCDLVEISTYSGVESVWCIEHPTEYRVKE